MPGVTHCLAHVPRCTDPFPQYSYPCEDGDVDLIKDASISLAAHGQYMYVIAQPT